MSWAALSWQVSVAATVASAQMAVTSRGARRRPTSEVATRRRQISHPASGMPYLAMYRAAMSVVPDASDGSAPMGANSLSGQVGLPAICGGAASIWRGWLTGPICEVRVRVNCPSADDALTRMGGRAGGRVKSEPWGAVERISRFRANLPLLQILNALAALSVCRPSRACAVLRVFAAACQVALSVGFNAANAEDRPPKF